MYNEKIKSENEASKMGVLPRKRKEKVVPITLRMPKWWTEKLERIAREVSLIVKDDVNHCDLIRDLIRINYIEPKTKVRYPRNCKECEQYRWYENMQALLKNLGLNQDSKSS